MYNTRFSASRKRKTVAGSTESLGLPTGMSAVFIATFYSVEPDITVIGVQPNITVIDVTIAASGVLSIQPMTVFVPL